MKIRDIWGMAAQEEHSQRKYTRLTMIFMAVALVFIIGVNSVVGSIKESMEGLLNRPFARVICMPGPQEMLMEYKEILLEQMEQEPVIGDVFEGSSFQKVHWEDSGEIVGKDNVETEVDSWFAGMQSYLTFGEGEPAYGEVVLPETLYDMGIYDSYNSVSAKTLVGKEITVRIGDEDSGDTWTEKLKVIGTYDNLTASTHTNFQINDRQMADWYRDSYKITDEKIEEMRNAYIEAGMEEDMEREIQEIYQGDEAAFFAAYLEPQTELCIYIPPEYSMEEAEEKLRDLIGTAGIRKITLDDSLMLYFDFLIYLGNLIAILFLIAAFANILIIVSAEMKRRRGEFALKQAVGYRKHQILTVFTVGKFFCFLKAAGIAAVLILLLSLAGNYVISHIFPFYLRYVNLKLEWNSLCAAALAVTAGTLMGLIPASVWLHRMNLTEILKREESV